MSDEPTWHSSLIQGFKHGYDKQEKSISDEAAPKSIELRDRAAAGLAEGIFNPFGWIKNLFK